MNSNGSSFIEIDLNSIQAPAKLKAEELIQKHIYYALEDRVGQRLNWVTSQSELDTQIPAGAGWVSFIDGTRGAGKSTFLHNAVWLLAEKYKHLAVMNWIDPSRIEASEILLLVLLQALNEKVKSKLATLATCEDTESKRERWRKAFKNVAGGLVLFQKDHHPLNELDEDLFLDLGLEQAGHSANLRKNLAHLFEVACGILAVKALLFAFDDADTSSQHAINLIETIRKYLDTPRVMIVITGDLELYALLVRQNFRHELARGKRDEWGADSSAGGRADQQKRMLDHLEEQYLLKLFPLRERHHLFPIWRLSDNSGGRKVTARFIEKTTSTDLVEFTRERIQKGFSLATKSDVDLYTEFFLMQPIRSVLQVLSRIQEIGEGTENDHMFSVAMLDLALQNLYNYNIAVEELAAEDFRTLTEAVFEVARDDGDPDTSAYLRPTSAYAHNRGAMFGLSAAVAQQLRHKPGTCISYLLRGPGMVKLAREAVNANKRGLNDAVLRTEFNRYMGVGRKDDALGWARLATVALVSEHAVNPTSRLVRCGVLGINQGKPKNSTFDSYSKVFATIAKEEDGGTKAYPAAVFSLVRSSVNGPRTFASIYNVLGLMGRLLQLTEMQGWRDQDVGERRRNIKGQLAGFYPNTNSVSVPPWSAVTNTDNKDPESEDTKDEATTQVNPSIDAWVDKLHSWLVASETITTYIQPSSVFMGKVWPRLFFGLENISEELRPQSKSNNDFAALMELFALCVVNAFLAEESTHHLMAKNAKGMSPTTLTNPRASAKNYREKLDEIKGVLRKERLPLTFIVATCPLITGLISVGKPDRRSTQNSAAWPFYIDDFKPDNFIEPSAWNELKKIAIQGAKKEEGRGNEKASVEISGKRPTKGTGKRSPVKPPQVDSDSSATNS